MSLVAGMPQKRQAVPPKVPPPPSSSDEEDEEEGEEEEEEEEDASTPVPSQPSLTKSVSVKPNSLPNLIHKHPHNNSSASSSGEEDDDKYGYEEEDSEVEKAKYIAAESRPAQHAQGRGGGKKANDESNEDQSSDSGSESESEKRTSSNTIEGGQKSKKPTLHPNNTSALQKQGGKAKSNENGSKNQKAPAATAAIGKGLETGAKKSSSIVQSQEDAIEILKGMMEFNERGMADVSSDFTAFHQFMSRKPLNATLNRQQLSRKIAELKRKFIKVSEELKAGKESGISKPNNRTLYLLSKKVWGKTGSTVGEDGETELEQNGGSGLETPQKMGSGDAKRISTAVQNEKGSVNAKRVLAAEERGDGSTKKRQKNADGESAKLIPDSSIIPEEAKDEPAIHNHMNEFLRSSGFFRGGSEWLEGVVKRAFGLMDTSQVKELDQRWMKLQWKEREIHMKRLSLAYELVQQCFDLVKSSSSSA